MKLYDRKLSWKIFCLIGQGRTLSHAAQECGIDLPYASRLISYGQICSVYGCDLDNP